GGIFDWDVSLKRLEELNALCEDPDLWSNPEKAQGMMKERNRLERKIQAVREVEQVLKDNSELIELGEAEGDTEIVL
ncbi:MAG TPA: peptide chain release factor 2, partial [Rhodospirillaceae bacterium]|nr:peptide chain release factor 2 [Rhodospirillaceae bacterium]